MDGELMLFGASPATEVVVGPTGIATDGYQEGLVLYESSTRHSQTFASIISLHDLVDSPSQSSTDDDEWFYPLEPPTHSTSDYDWEMDIIYEQQDQVVQLRPQQLSGSRNVQQMMTSQELNPSQMSQHSRNSAMRRYSLEAFSNDEPVVHFNRDNFGAKPIMDKNIFTDKTLWEINSKPVDEFLQFDLDELLQFVAQDPVQNSTISDSTETYPNSMGVDISDNSYQISIGCDPSLHQLNMPDVINFITKGSQFTPIEGDNITAIDIMQVDNNSTNEPTKADNIQTTVHIATPMTTIPQKQQTKKRGRPRKPQAVPMDEQQNTDLQYYQERSCKRNSLKKIRNSLSEESEADQECSLIEAKDSRTRVKKASCKSKPDEEVPHNAGTLSPASQSDVSLEDDPLEKRRKNNEASKRSRDKRKKEGERLVETIVILQKRNEHLSSMALELEKARDIVTSTVLGNLPQANNIA